MRGSGSFIISGFFFGFIFGVSTRFVFENLHIDIVYCCEERIVYVGIDRGPGRIH